MTNHRLARGIGLTLTRLIVPLWILAGALFKLYERNPQNLPVVIREFAWRKLNTLVQQAGWSSFNLDLLVLMRVLIGLELFAAAVMLLVPRLSRAMATFMLCSFCGILIGELIMKAQNCGCFGSLPVKPWHMLIIDGSLLAGILVSWFVERSGATTATPPSKSSIWKPASAMIPLLALGLAISFAVPEPPPTVEPPLPKQADSEEIPPAPADPQVNPNPLPIPSSWYTASPGVQTGWIGKPWREIDLFRLLRRWPKDLDTGKHYVVFYSRTCEHCEAMFYDHLVVPLDAPVTAIQIPNGKDVLTGEGAWAMPQLPETTELLELPLGCNWIITPPLAITIVDGKITCAIEGEGYEKCLWLN